MSLIISVKDAYRQAVEAASGGKNTVMYDDRGNPSIMVAIPRFNLSDVIEGAPTTPHPAFIVNGVIKDVIWISKYQNITHDGRAYSIPGVAPRTAVTLNEARAVCQKKGLGWHLMNNAEWSAVALWSKKNGTLPRGNSNFGSDIVYNYEKIITATKGEDGRTNLGKTGTGPATWSHDHTPDGIYDLNGNISEWTDGLKISDGRIIYMNDNDFNSAESNWVKSNSHFDSVDGLVINNKRTITTGNSSRKFKQITAAEGHSIPDLLKYLGIAPYSVNDEDDAVYVNFSGEYIASRGGSWLGGEDTGLFNLVLTVPRDDGNLRLGFRSAFVL